MSGWWSCLHEPWNTNPFVIVVMQPSNWSIHIRETKDDKYRFAVLHSPQGTIKGLQVIDTGLDNYMEHRNVMAKYGVEPADPAYIGKLGDIYNDLLLDADREPLAVLRDKAWRNPLGLKRVWKGLKVAA